MYAPRLHNEKAFAICDTLARLMFHIISWSVGCESGIGCCGRSVEGSCKKI
jgi:hypothetical protein